MRILPEQLAYELRQALTASGCGTFTVRRDGQAVWEGYPHPLTRGSGRYAGTVDELMARARLAAPLEALFGGDHTISVELEVDDRCVALRGAVEVVDGIPVASGICSDVTEQK